MHRADQRVVHGRRHVDAAERAFDAALVVAGASTEDVHVHLRRVDGGQRVTQVLEGVEHALVSSLANLAVLAVEEGAEVALVSCTSVPSFTDDHGQLEVGVVELSEDGRGAAADFAGQRKQLLEFGRQHMVPFAIRALRSRGGRARGRASWR